MGDSIEFGFKICLAHIAQRSDLAQEHAETLSLFNVRLVDEVPANIRESSGPLFTKNRIFATIATQGANIYILSAEGSTACRVVIADTQDALRQRINFVDRLRETTAWNYDRRRSGTGGGMMRDELTSTTGRMVAIMNGPNTIFKEGKGVQAILTVALVPPQYQSAN